MTEAFTQGIRTPMKANLRNIPAQSTNPPRCGFCTGLFPEKSNYLKENLEIYLTTKSNWSEECGQAQAVEITLKETTKHQPAIINL